MTKQEIEKAIENGKSVWVANKYCIPYEVNLTNNHYIDIADNKESLMLAHIDDVELIDYLEYIFETKEKAQHYHYHANITRTEQLPFLSWEEFKEIGQISFIGKDKKEYILKKDIIWSNNKYTLVDCLKIFNETDFTFSKYFDYTEANFYKAYDECVRLFRGEQL